MLEEAWTSANGGKYSSLRRILRCEENVTTITNTLYRFLVMIGLPNAEKAEGFDSLYDYENNPILNALKKLFKLRYKRGGAKKTTSLLGSGKLWKSYTRQCKEYRIYDGKNEYMRRAQTHMQNISGAKDLLQRLLFTQIAAFQCPMPSHMKCFTPSKVMPLLLVH